MANYYDALVFSIPLAFTANFTLPFPSKIVGETKMVIPFYMLLRTRIGQSTTVVHQIQKIAGVKFVHSVMGHYDIILYAEGTDIEDVRRIREAIHQMNGVTITETAIHT